MISQYSIVYLDNHLIVVNKTAGLLVQGDKSRDKSLLDEVKHVLAHKFNKPGEVFVGLVHRLDRPVSGLVVLARNSKSAARLSQQIRQKHMQKKYIALVEGDLLDNTGTLTDHLQRFGKVSRVTKAGGKPSKLTFKRIAQCAGISLIEIDLITGRHHQIRAQFSSRHHPIVGDVLYGAKKTFRSGQIALHSYFIGIHHPISREALAFYSQMPDWAYLKRNR